jgi:hypothetical protein
MNLNYVFNNDSERLKHAETQGYDLDTLFMLLKEVFNSTHELQLPNQEFAETFYRLKNVADSKEGRAPEPEVILYENSAVNPTRLAVELKPKGHTVFFRVLPGQKCDKSAQLAKCEACRDAVGLRRGEMKQHVLDRHST